jgi:hypothetical protein
MTNGSDGRMGLFAAQDLNEDAVCVMCVHQLSDQWEDTTSPNGSLSGTTSLAVRFQQSSTSVFVRASVWSSAPKCANIDHPNPVNLPVIQHCNVYVICDCVVGQVTCRFGGRQFFSSRGLHYANLALEHNEPGFESRNVHLPSFAI